MCRQHSWGEYLAFILCTHLEIQMKIIYDSNKNVLENRQWKPVRACERTDAHTLTYT